MSRDAAVSPNTSCWGGGVPYRWSVITTQARPDLVTSATWVGPCTGHQQLSGVPLKWVHPLLGDQGEQLPAERWGEMAHSACLPSC